MSVMRILMMMLWCVVLGGCASGGVYSGGSASIEAPGVERERMIAVVREVLGSYRFSIDRVDASRGVVTTGYKRTHGLATPWDLEQGSLSAEVTDFANQHERSVRVEFEDDGVVRVSVFVRRTGRPGWRVETESIRYSSQHVVFVDDGVAMGRRSYEQVGQDGALAARLAEEIERGLTGS